jgi:hypothetical protein
VAPESWEEDATYTSNCGCSNRVSSDDSSGKCCKVSRRTSDRCSGNCGEASSVACDDTALDRITSNGCSRKLSRKDTANTGKARNLNKISSDGCTGNGGGANNGYTGDVGRLNRSASNRLAADGSGDTDARGKETRATNSEITTDGMVTRGGVTTCNQSLERTSSEVRVNTGNGCTTNLSSKDSANTSNAGSKNCGSGNGCTGDCRKACRVTSDGSATDGASGGQVVFDNNTTECGKTRAGDSV